VFVTSMVSTPWRAEVSSCRERESRWHRRRFQGLAGQWKSPAGERFEPCPQCPHWHPGEPREPPVVRTGAFTGQRPTVSAWHSLREQGSVPRAPASGSARESAPWLARSGCLGSAQRARGSAPRTPDQYRERRISTASDSERVRSQVRALVDVLAVRWIRAAGAQDQHRARRDRSDDSSPRPARRPPVPVIPRKK